MLQFISDGFRLFEYVETSETRVRSMHVGESEFVFRVPVKEPILKQVATSLNELFDSNKVDRHYDVDAPVADKIYTEEFKAWVDHLISPDDVKKAAEEELERRKAEGDQEVILCSNCKGKGCFETVCSCTLGGIVFTDMTNETEDSVVSLRKNGVVDPDYENCEGTGKNRNDCPYCEGCAKAAKYPQIILKNEVTDEERILKLDLATLIVQGEVTVEWSGFEKLYPNDYQASEKIIRFNVSDYIDRTITDMGIDKDNAIRISGDSVTRINSEQANISGIRAYWRKQNGTLQTGYNRGQDTMSATDVLQSGQLSLSHGFAWPYGKLKNEDGVVVTEEWILRPTRPIVETLEDTKTAVAEYGYTLGYALSFIATGEVGPSFFLLDGTGNVLGQLSNEYYIRESLENAWLHFQKIREQLPKPE